MAISEAKGSFESLFPRTRYFEFDSVNTGARHAVWVTVPVTYPVDADRHFPVIYEPDGNIGFPQSAPIDAMLYFDPIDPITPFIKVSIGYVPDDAPHFNVLRGRDLIPPHDAVANMLDAMLAELLANHYVGEETAEIGRKLTLGGADRFQAFIEEELHPALSERFRIDSGRAGLWGYSLGGLFTSYVALKRSALFKTIGAGSPGILIDGSMIFDFHHAQCDAGRDYEGRCFHLTVAQNEISVPTYYQSLVGAGTARLMALMGQRPLPGLRMTSEIIPLESHATGFAPSWFSFLRACYSAREDKGPIS